ncbi:MAG: N-acetylglucosamine kinase, partial [Candidatus Scatosoma sp.]
MKYYLGIDGGGTKTDFLLVNETGKALARRIEKGSNPNDIGIEGTYQVFVEGLKSLCEEQAISPKQITLFCGGSGCGVGSYSKELTERLDRIVARASVSSDIANITEIGLFDQDGIVAIAGTGSAFAIQKSQTVRLIGGNGFLFEDYGSGYAVARAGFKAILDEEDGFGQKTVLKELFEENLHGGIKKNLGTLYKGGKSLMASFAPLVFRGAEYGDGAAKDIIARNENYMAEVLNVSVQRYALTKIALAGGLFKNQAFVYGVKEKLCGEIDLCVPALPPVCGAVRRAVKLNGGCNTSFMRALQESLSQEKG